MESKELTEARQQLAAWQQNPKCKTDGLRPTLEQLLQARVARLERS